MINVTPPIHSQGEPFVVSAPEQPIPAGWTPTDLAFAMEEVDDEQRAIDTVGTQTRWQFYPVQVENRRFSVRTEALMGHRLQFGVAR